MSRTYKLLSVIALIFTPLSMGLGIAYDVFMAESVNMPGLMAFVVAASVVISLESVGILAGKITADFIKAKDKQVYFTGAVLLAYGIIGFVKLYDSPLWFVPLVAIMVDLLVGMYATSEEGKQAKEQQRQERRQDRRQLQQEKRATKKQPQTQPERNQSATVDGLTSGQLKVYNAWNDNPGATQQQIAEALGVSRQYVSKTTKQLNGLVTK